MGARAATDVEVLVAGRYRLCERLGAGAMGTVWSAIDERLAREVAVKLGRRDLGEGTEGRLRAEREAALAARLNHPNAVAVYDGGVDDDIPFLVMERLSGATLRDRLAAGPLDDHELGRLAADLLAVLGAAHRASLLHRDVKPSNVLVGNLGEWKLGDFGIAKPLDEGVDDLTRVGMVVGTPAYLAPERHLGAPATVAADLFSAAVLLREAAGAGPSATGEADPPRSRRRRAFLAALEPALSPDPAARYADADAMADALVAADRSARPPRRGSAAAPTVAVPVAAPPAGRSPDSAPTAQLDAGEVPTRALARPTAPTRALPPEARPTEALAPVALVADATDATDAADPSPTRAGEQRHRRGLAVVGAVALAALAWFGFAEGSTDRPAVANEPTVTTTAAPTTTAPPTTAPTTVPTTAAPAPATTAPRPQAGGRDKGPKADGKAGGHAKRGRKGPGKG
jgi:hypothetical protein